ncbi:MAG: ferredoxin family protein [Desulfobacter sp.]
MTIQKIDGCIGCGTCVQTCPTDVIRMDEKGQKAFIAYPDDCQLCHLCRMYCPEDAITVSSGKTVPVMVPWG